MEKVKVETIEKMAKETKAAKQAMAFRFTPEIKKIIESLAAINGLSQADMLSRLVENEANRLIENPDKLSTKLVNGVTKIVKEIK